MYALWSYPETAPREPTRLPLAKAHAPMVAASGLLISLIEGDPLGTQGRRPGAGDVPRKVWQQHQLHLRTASPLLCQLS